MPAAEAATLADVGLTAVSRLAASGTLALADEDKLVDGLLGADARFLLLAKHYAAGDPKRFLRHALRLPSSSSSSSSSVAAAGGVAAGVAAAAAPAAPATMAAGADGGGAVIDAVVVGGGLAGLTAALTILDRGGSVVLLEKEAMMGGNSAWASSGINGVIADAATATSGVSSSTASAAAAAAAGTTPAGKEAAAAAVAKVAEAARASGDSVAAFREDITKAAGRASDDPLLSLAKTLADDSGDALRWLHERVGVTLNKVGQLGGHSKPRTHRPTEGLTGMELVHALNKKVEKFKEDTGDGRDAVHRRLTVRKKARMVRILTDEATGAAIGVEYVDAKKNKNKNKNKSKSKSNDEVAASGTHTVRARSVVLATGGYASDRSASSLLQQHRPDLVKLATTNGRWATGDAVKAATMPHVGAGTVEMEHVQVHPTGFVDPKKPEAETKTLCAEILRGVGGVLLDSKGRRFCDELGTRDYVTRQMVEHAETRGGGVANPKAAGAAGAAAGGRGGGEGGEPKHLPHYTLVLNSASAAIADKHVPLYLKKGLLRRYSSLEALARGEVGGAMPAATIRETLDEYADIAEASTSATATAAAATTTTTKDPFGKRFFENAAAFRRRPEGKDEEWFAGTVTPVLHYSMGGLRIDTAGRVLRAADDTTPVRGLYAAGEVAGGIHGRTYINKSSRGGGWSSCFRGTYTCADSFDRYRFAGFPTY